MTEENILEQSTILRQGMILQGRYRLEKSLGQGGMGDVFRALDLQGNKTVAIKRMFGKGARERQRFKREYNLLSKIDHPNILKAHEFFEQDKDLYMVVEFMPGESMGSILKKGVRVFSLPEQLAIANKVARGLEVIHLAGIIHRDIKPENIMVDAKSGQVKLIDLGIGKSFEQNMRLTQDGENLGTLAYMSPEQLDAKELGVESDIFSLGVTLYQFFLWEPKSPFDGETYMDIMFGMINKEPVNLYEEICERLRMQGASPTEKGKMAYHGLSEIIHKAMKKKAKERWPDSGMMANELEKIYGQFMRMQEYRKSLTNTVLAVTTPGPDKKLSETLDEIRAEESGEKEEKKTTSQRKTGRVARHKAKEKRSPNLGTGVAMAVLLVAVGLVVAVGWKLSENVGAKKNAKDEKKQEPKIEPAKKEEPLQAKKSWVSEFQNLSGLSQNEIEKMLDGRIGEDILDMSSDEWMKLGHERQAKLTEYYQRAYAKAKGLELEKTITQPGATFVFRLIPPGRFWMGSNDEVVKQIKEIYKKNNWLDYDETRHRVVISKAYYLQKTEITQEQWRSITGKTPWKEKGNVQENEQWAATYISWNDIRNEFLPKLGKRFTLPTEAQWEYACRAGTTGRFYWGESEKEMQKYANVGDKTYQKKYPQYKGLDIDDGFAEIAPVGSLQANGFGLHDMTGNVYEWCNDCYGKYASEEEIDPAVRFSGSLIVFRGGSWACYGFKWLRSVYRGRGSPSYVVYDLGVRLVFLDTF